MSVTKFIKPELLVDLPCRTGEGPLWHPDDKKIYWTDIPAAMIHSCRADGSELKSFFIDDQVGGFTIQEDGALLLFMSRGMVKKWRNGKFLETFLDGIPEESDSRFNDVVTDPLGRVFCGTMSSASHGGRLYRLDPDGTLNRLRDNMETPNGMGFSPDGRYFYQNDSGKGEIHRFVYHKQSGEISDMEIIFQADPSTGEGRPDGLTVDAEGFIWTARWDGGRIVRHNPDGSPEQEIELPVAKVSSLTIAGPDMRTAFITSAGGDKRDDPKEGAVAGALFVCREMPVAGRPEFKSKIGITVSL